MRSSGNDIQSCCDKFSLNALVPENNPLVRFCCIVCFLLLIITNKILISITGLIIRVCCHLLAHQNSYIKNDNDGL